MKQEERTRITKQKILDAALEIFGSKGYEAGSIGDICKSGDINRGLLYHNYESKDALYLECLRVSCDELLKRFDAAEIEKLEDPAEMARAYLTTRAAFVRECPSMSRIVFECMVNPPDAIRDGVKASMQELNERNRLFCEKLLSHMELRDGISMEMAMDYLSLVQYAFNSSFSLPETGEDALTKHEQKLGTLLNCAFFGIAKQKEA